MKYSHVLKCFLTTFSTFYHWIILIIIIISIGITGYVRYDILTKAVTNTFSWDVIPCNRIRNTGVSPERQQHPYCLAEICWYSSNISVNIGHGFISQTENHTFHFIFVVILYRHFDISTDYNSSCYLTTHKVYNSSSCLTFFWNIIILLY
jgi:hypothetical protein